MKNTKDFKFYVFQLGLPAMYIAGFIMKLIAIYRYGWESELKLDKLLCEFLLLTLCGFISAIALYLTDKKRNKTTNEQSE